MIHVRTKETYGYFGRVYCTLRKYLCPYAKLVRDGYCCYLDGCILEPMGDEAEVEKGDTE